MTAFMPAGCKCLLPSLILARVIELHLLWNSGAVSLSDKCPCIPGMTCIL